MCASHLLTQLHVQLTAVCDGAKLCGVPSLPTGCLYLSSLKKLISFYGTVYPSTVVNSRIDS